MDEILTKFFNMEYEKKINRQMLYYNYSFPQKDILDYINNLIIIPVEKYVNYIIEQENNVILEAQDVFQFSNLKDATVKICNKLIEIDNPGISFLQAGKLLHDDGELRKDGAYTKYGENHLKTAQLLGLTYELSNIYFLSCIGACFTELNNDSQFQLLIRLILRSKLISRLIRASKNGNVDVRQLLYMLSESTYIRRRSNIRMILKILQESKEYDFENELVRKLIL